jgi:DNA mismatch repair ATPase MutS
MILNSYQAEIANQSAILKTNSKYALRLSLFRLTIFVLLGLSFWGYYTIKNPMIFILSGILVGVFIWLVKMYSQSQWKIKIVKKKIELLQAEVSFLNNGEIENNNGYEFVDSDHPYTYDLDIFGPNSLFHHINRTVTFKGFENLAHRLSQSLSIDMIPACQHAIKELNVKAEFRLHFAALGTILKDDKSEYEKLSTWLTSADSKPILNDLLLKILSVIPILSFGISTLFELKIFEAIFYSIITLNITLLLLFYKKIQKEISITERIVETTKKYGLLLKHIELENFNSPYLIELKNKLIKDNKMSSLSLQKFSEILNSLDSIHNILPATLINGLTLYHIHQFNALIQWKQDNKKLLEEWVQVISDFDALQSFAGFSYNNPNFVFPEINNEKEIVFQNLGHPLIPEDQRIYNNIDFVNSFYILTGSNMSGKSTFLRAVGVNMVLAMAGSCVCAHEAKFYPVQLWTSMRQNDALHKHYSYFFAEVKRLKAIFENLEQNDLFILLDEILKGTNSEDKLHGSLEVSKKILRKNINGIIATHDIEIAELTNTFDNARSVYFQSKIENNDITFDYILRNGICTSKSATFLLKKEGVL